MIKKNIKLKLIILALLLVSVISMSLRSSVQATQVSKPIQSEVVDSVSQSTVTVRYVDELGASLAASTVLMGSPGDSYQTTPKDIKNFKLVDPAPTNANGVFSRGPQVVTYTYTRLPGAPTGAPIYAIYRDSGIIDQDWFYGNIGDKITIRAKKIAGYVCRATPTDFIFSQKTQGVVYHYIKAVQTTVTMKFVDESGNKLTDDIVNNVEEDTIYTAKPATISNYTLTKMPDNAKGVVGKEPVTVTFVYAKNETHTGSGVNSGNKPTQNVSSNKSTKSTLPQTGENNLASAEISIIGMVVVLLVETANYKKQW